MRLRNQLLALSLLTLLLPWAGWQLVQELENFLREGEENALLASARTIARALPPEFQTDLQPARGRILPLRQLTTEPILDGYMTDWPEVGKSLEFAAAGGMLKLDVLAGRYRSRAFLLLKVTDPGDIQATTFNTGLDNKGQDNKGMGAAGQRAGLMLYIQSKRGQHGFMIATEAPGPLTVFSQGDRAKRLEAAWMDVATGYQVELSLPADVERISVGAVAPAFTMQGLSAERFAGTLRGRQPGQWLQLAGRDDAVARWMSDVVPTQSRAWLLQAGGWVMADSGPLLTPEKSELTWVQRIIYQVVAPVDMPLREPLPEWPIRFESDAVERAIEGGDGTQWSRDPDSAVVYNLVAVPVFSGSEASGAVVSGAVVSGVVVMEASSDGLLLMTNRALGRLLFITLLVVVVLAAGLWLFASRLSLRVQKLSAAVNRAMDDAGQLPALPQTAAGDELGELARNTEKLLRAVAEYTGYLHKLAGRLSHELKTPIAITRSSLENLAENLSGQALDPQAQQYLSRAREGLDRQAAIVRAMSEAQRLEGSVKTADWDEIDLGAMLGHCVDGYRSVYPKRTIRLNLPADSSRCELRCAPELIAQALDKLVDNAVTLSAHDCAIVITLKCEQGDCLISVVNSGTRLPDVLHEQLFDSLVSHRETGSGGQHLGLGLYIVRLVAEAHGGKVSAHNLPDDTGVEFIIRLPAA